MKKAIIIIMASMASIGIILYRKFKSKKDSYAYQN